MDFLDPLKMRRHTQMLFLGYGLIAIAIVATALVLVYQSSGYGVNRKGEVVQNGLVFTASTPSGAEVYIDGQDSGSQTNRQFRLLAGQYVMQFRKAGYDTWAHNVTIRGGDVNRLDYAFLFPKQLQTVGMASYAQAPLLVTQSPDQRWLMVMFGDGTRNVAVYDLKNIDKEPLIASLPASVSGPTSSNWQLVEWSTDNRHILVSRTLNGANDFVLLDRQDPTQSIDLNKTLGQNPTDIRLHDKKFDQYYLYDQATKSLQTASLGQPAPLAYLSNVLAFKPYGSDRMLYVTDDAKQTTATDQKLAVKLVDGNQTYTIRSLSPGNHYLLEMAGYSDDLYIAAGVDTENKVLVYKNPIDQINNPDLKVAVPISTLRATAPDYIAFSQSAQYVMTEGGQSFGVYDAQNDKTFNYQMTVPLDAPATHADWMDGNRLTYPSDGKLLVFDADHTNRHSLMVVNPGYFPALTPDRKRFVVVAPAASGVQLAYTWLRTAADR